MRHISYLYQKIFIVSLGIIYFQAIQNCSSLNTIQGSSNNEEESIITKTLALLAEGDSLIELSPVHESIILVVGNTGTGKSTLVQLIAGDNSQLESYKRAGSFLIRDVAGKISTKTSVSKSIFPERVIRNQSNSVFYDCPGFSDTRAATPYIEIGNAFFIRKVASHGSKIKLVIVVNHFSLQPDADRNDFPSLLKHMSILLNGDVKKFKDGIVMVASKVKSRDDDDEIIENIGNFLQELKLELPEVLSEAYMESALDLLDALLEKKDGEYHKIGLFRAPSEIGLLSQIRQVQDNKRDLIHLIENNIQYVNKLPSDFGYALSSNGLLLINDLVVNINQNITLELSKIVESLQLGLIQELQDWLNDPEQQNTQALELILEAAVSPILYQSISKSTNLGILEAIVNKLKSCSSNKVINKAHALQNILNQGQYLEFLQNARGSQTPITIELSLWNLPLQNFQQTISRYLAGNYTLSLHSALLNSLVNLHQETASNYLEELSDVLGLPERYAMLKHTLENLLSLKKELLGLDKSAGLVKFIEQQVAGLSMIGISVPKDDQFIAYLNILRFIHNLGLQNDVTINWEPLRWLISLENSIKLLNNEKLRLEFQLELQDELTDNQVQVHNANNIKNTSLDGIKGNISIFWESFSFLKTPTRFRGVVEPMLELENHTQEVHQLLGMTLADGVTCEEDGENSGVILVKGVYVTLSEALAKCSQTGTEALAIFATSTFYVDTDFDRSSINDNHAFQLIIIAPIWKLIGSHHFNLNGGPGEESSRIQNGLVRRTRAVAQKGVDGRPGHPGFNGGHFYGIGSRFDKVSPNDVLMVSMDGGNGENGKAGGAGSDGRRGRDAYFKNWSSDRNRYLTDHDIAACWASGNVRIDWYPFDYYDTLGDNWFRFRGERGTFGGAGGAGGRGGQGGYGGSFNFINLNSGAAVPIENLFTTSSNKGLDGQDGQGGIGGLNGPRGSSIKFYVTNYYSTYFHERRCWLESHSYETGQSNGDRGSRGVTGGNLANQQIPPYPNNPNPSNSMPHFINSYKEMGRTWLTNQYLSTPTNEFLHEIESNEKIRNSYSLKDQLQDFERLESQYLQLVESNPKYLLPFYESLLNRIYESWQQYTNNAEPDNLIDNSKYKAYTLLYSVVLSKVVSLKIPLESYLVIDILEYSELIKTTVTKLQAQLTASQRLDIVQAHKASFEAQLNEKFKEGQELIENVIQPEIKAIHARIRDNIDRLLEEISELKRQTEQNTVALQKKYEELKAQMKLNVLFGALSIGSSLLGFLGPIGAGASAILTTGIGIAQSATVSGATAETTLLKLPDSILSATEGLSSAYGQYTSSKLDAYKQQITDIQTMLKPSADGEESSQKINKKEVLKLSAITKKTAEIQVRIAQEQQKIDAFASSDASTTLNPEQLASIEESNSYIEASKDELESLLDETQESIKAEETKSEQTQAILGNIHKTTRVISMGVDIYNKYRGDQSKLEILADQIEESKRQEVKVEQHRQNVNNLLIPMVQNIEEGLSGFQSSLSSRSRTSLEVGKWEVANTLRELKSTISGQFTQGFATDDDMRKCFDLLEEAITTLIKVYDRLQAYGEQASLVQVITGMASASFQSIDLSSSNDPELAELANVELLIQSNLILQQYNLMLNSFKMWVFPFGDLYMTDLVPLVGEGNSNLNTREGLTTMALNAGQNIEKLIRKLRSYKTTIVSYDQNLIHKIFNGSHAHDSFYVWSHKEYRSEISKLLSGEKVTLFANLGNSALNGMIAVKFSQIELNLVIQGNGGSDAKLREALKGYKVSLTHGGNSYYSFNHKIAVITSNKLIISYSFARDVRSGLPMQRNEVYNKLSSGDLLLSPYGLWEIQISPIVGTATSIVGAGNNCFESLKNFIGEHIDLQLNGVGTYINDLNSSEFNMKGYYASLFH